MRRAMPPRTPEQSRGTYVITPGHTPGPTPPSTPRQPGKLEVPYTTLSPTPATRLRANSTSAINIPSKIGLILRSAYFGRRDYTKDEAFADASTILTLDPTHNLANYITGLHAAENYKQDQAIVCLQIAANPENLPSNEVPYSRAQEIIGNAAYKLACMHLAKHRYIEAAAWFTHALIHKSPDAREGFLKDTFIPLATVLPDDFCATTYPDRKEWRSTYALMQIIFILTTLQRCRIGNEATLPNCAWLKHLPEPTEEELYLNASAAIKRERLYDDVDAEDRYPELNRTHGTSYLRDLLESAIKNDPYIVYDVTSYCFHQNIIAPELYGKLVTHIGSFTTDPGLINRIKYGQFKIELLMNPRADDGKASTLFATLLENDFIDFSLDEIGATIADVEDRDPLLYALFILFCRKGGYEKSALECLRRISPSFTGYDETYTAFFKNDEADLNVYRLKQKVITYALANLERQGVKNPPLQACYNDSYSVSGQIHAAILRCNDLFQNHLHTVEKMRAKRPMFYFFHDTFSYNYTKERIFIAAMASFAAHSLIQHPTDNEADYQQLQQAVLVHLAHGKKDEELQHVCKDAESILRSINLLTPSTLSQQTTAAAIPKPPRRPPSQQLFFGASAATAAATSAATTAAAAAAASSSLTAPGSISSLPQMLASPPHVPAPKR